MRQAKAVEEWRGYGKSKSSTKERSRDSLSVPNKNTILINIKSYYFTRYGKNTKNFN